MYFPPSADSDNVEQAVNGMNQLPVLGISLDGLDGTHTVRHIDNTAADVWLPMDDLSTKHCGRKLYLGRGHPIRHLQAGAEVRCTWMKPLYNYSAACLSLFPDGAVGVDSDVVLVKVCHPGLEFILKLTVGRVHLFHGLVR